MGCDIHLYVELRTAAEWVLLPTPAQFCYDLIDESEETKEALLTKARGIIDKLPVKYPFDLDALITAGKFPSPTESWDANDWACGERRNYSCFSILAGVRAEGRECEPIARPRGIPHDASTTYREIVARWGIDGHSHSFFTLAELLDFPWERVQHHRGLVPAAVYREWWHRGRQGTPRAYCMGAGGGRIKHVTNTELEKILTLQEELAQLGAAAVSDNAAYYTWVEWTTTYAEGASSFYDRFIPAVKKLGYPPKDTRLVFFFDN